MPVMPSEGSVGASGDLTPLSYLAAVCAATAKCCATGCALTASAALAAAGIAPLTLRPKEALAIMNGTAVMTGLACLALVRAEYLFRLTSRITALASFALDGNAIISTRRYSSVKAASRSATGGGWLRQDLPGGSTADYGKRLQDRYSIRCAPHVIGVLADALPWLRRPSKTN